MSWWNRIERRLEPLAIQNITLYIVMAQAFIYLTAMFRLIDLNMIVFRADWFLGGDWWRVFTFVAMPAFVPGATGGTGMLQAVFFAFLLYFIYMAGTAVEQHLGVVRYNLFLFVGYLLTVAAAFATPHAFATNAYLGGMIFLGLAYLNPMFTIYILFVLPVRLKWLAILLVAYWVLILLTGPWSLKLAVLAAATSFLLFFGRALLQDLRAGRRQQHQQVRREELQASSSAPRHRCHVCEKNSDTHPDLDFRYCSKCAGDQCYCPDHIRDHEHVLTDESDASRK
jgi:hypothetical protein